MSNRRKLKDPSKTPRSEAIRDMKRGLAELEVAEKLLQAKEGHNGPTPSVL